MTKKHVGRVAANLLRTFADNQLLAIGDLKGKIGEPMGDQIDDRHAGEEYVEVLVHPRDASAIVVRYFRRIGQTPMQIVLRAAGCKLQLTCTEELPGYEVFDEQPGYGKMQDRPFAGFPEVIAELDQLSTLTSEF